MSHRIPPIATGDRCLLSCIMRAAVARCTEEGPGYAITGVLLEPAGEHIRCVATDGKILAVVHAWAAGIDLPGPVLIQGDQLPRIVDLYRRLKSRLRGWMVKNDPARGGAPFLQARVEDQQRGSKPFRLLHLSAPSVDDGCTVVCNMGAIFPTYRHLEKPGLYRTGFTAGSSFNLGMLMSAQRILATGICDNLIPHDIGRGTVFTNYHGQTPDYVLVMPISLPSTELSLFGGPGASLPASAGGAAATTSAPQADPTTTPPGPGCVSPSLGAGLGTPCGAA